MEPMEGGGLIMRYHRHAVVVVVVAALWLSAWPASGEMGRPTGVPDLSDPEVLARFIPLVQSRLNEDPDFPALLLGNTASEFPQFLLVILDARNGKDTWSLREDIPILFLLLADLRTVQQGFLDEGFVTRGFPSGKFIAAGPESAEGLLARARESHRRLRVTSHFRPAAWAP